MQLSISVPKSHDSLELQLLVLRIRSHTVIASFDWYFGLCGGDRVLDCFRVVQVDSFGPDRHLPEVLDVFREYPFAFMCAVAEV